MLSSSSDIPDDVLLEIFLFLPADSIIRFRFVCKYWFDLITRIGIKNPRFVQMHIDHQHTLFYNATTTTTTATTITDTLPTILCTAATSTSRSIDDHNLYSLNNNNASISSSSSSKNKKRVTEIVYPCKSPSSRLKILGSCNGLLCIQVFVDNDKYDFTDTTNQYFSRYFKKIVHRQNISICLWNPTTHEFKQVPDHPSPIQRNRSKYEFVYDPSTKAFKQIPTKVLLIEKTADESKISNNSHDTYGFGYIRFRNDYKLVRLVCLATNNNEGKLIIKHQVYVYTLGTNSWKMVDKEMSSDSSITMQETGLYVNDALHWITCNSRVYRKIYAFDIEDEEFREVPMPGILMYGVKLQVLRGCLCIFRNFESRELVTELWMMMDYGVKETWTKLFTIMEPHPPLNMKPIWICKNGEIVMGYHTNGKDDLVIYDPKNNKVIESIGSQGIPFNWAASAIVHIGSLVSLKSATYVGQEQQSKKEEDDDEEKLKFIHTNRSNLLRF